LVAHTTKAAQETAKTEKLCAAFQAWAIMRAKQRNRNSPLDYHVSGHPPGTETRGANRG
jgi:hypothetical protein